MSLLDDPLFAELRAEATQWHLTQSATVRRYGTMLVNGRDQPTEALIFYGLVGVHRRDQTCLSWWTITPQLPRPRRLARHGAR